MKGTPGSGMLRSPVLPCRIASKLIAMLYGRLAEAIEMHTLHLLPGTLRHPLPRKHMHRCTDS